MHDPNSDDAMNQLTKELLQEKRSDRRWKNIRFIFWFLLFTYIVVGIFSLLNNSSTINTKGLSKHVALIRLEGMIAPGRNFSAETVLPLLEEAFQDKKAAGIIIDINSPGGTPVQAAIIHDAIVALKKQYKKKVIVVGEDMLTSGAYYVAVAADKIYVNPNTLTGSVGVIVKGFGFVDLIKKLGIERRVYTAGNNKDRLDPFLKQNPDDLQKIQQVMEEIHQNFITAVTKGRAGKLHSDPANLFNGDFWSGNAALQLGLVDGLGNWLDVMQQEFHTDNYKEYGESPLFNLLGQQFASALDTVIYTYG
jgi:protease IV